MQPRHWAVVLIFLLIVGCIRIPDENRLVSYRSVTTPAGPLAKTSMLAQPTGASAAFPYAETMAKHRRKVLNADEFTLVSWNVYKGSMPGWVEDFKRLSRHSDLFILQEAYLTEDLTQTLAGAKYQWDMTAAYEYRDIPTGVLTAARTTPSETFMLRDQEPILRVPKSILFSRFPLSGTDRELLVANIHGINFTIDRAAFEVQIHRMEKVLAEHEGPLIVSGDFNTWTTGRIALVNAMSKRLGLSAVQFGEDNRSRFFGFGIDHIFYRGLQAKHAEIPLVSTSDHNPLSVTFALETPADEFR